MQDPTEAEPMTATIQHISKGSPGILTLRKEADAHYFHNGDLVTFSSIEGMVELNHCDPRPIHVQGEPTPLQLQVQGPSSRWGQMQPGPWGWVLPLPSSGWSEIKNTDARQDGVWETTQVQRSC